MSIQIIDGFKLGTSKPIDDRIVGSGSLYRNNITYKYDGLLVVDTNDHKPYIWNSNNLTWSEVAPANNNNGSGSSITELTSNNKKYYYIGTNPSTVNSNDLALNITGGLNVSGDIKISSGKFSGDGNLITNINPGNISNSNGQANQVLQLNASLTPTWTTISSGKIITSSVDNSKNYFIGFIENNTGDVLAIRNKSGVGIQNNVFYLTGDIGLSASVGTFSRVDIVDLNVSRAGTFSRVGITDLNVSRAGTFSRTGIVDLNVSGAGTFSRTGIVDLNVSGAATFSRVQITDLNVSGAATFSRVQITDLNVGRAATFSRVQITDLNVGVAGTFSRTGIVDLNVSGAGTFSRGTFNYAFSTGLSASIATFSQINVSDKIIVDNNGFKAAAFSPEDILLTGLTFKGVQNSGSANNTSGGNNSAYINAVSGSANSTINGVSYTSRWVQLNFKFNTYSGTTISQQLVSFPLSQYDRVFYCGVGGSASVGFKGYEAKFFIGDDTNGNYLGRFLSNNGQSGDIYNGTGTFYVPSGHKFSILFEWYVNSGSTITDSSGLFGMYVRSFPMKLK